MSSTSSDKWVSVVFGHVSNTVWYQCAFQSNTGDLGLWYGTSYLTDAATTDDLSRTSTIHRRIHVYYDGTTLTCTLDHSTLGQVGQVSYDVSDLPMAISGGGGLRVYNEGAAFDSFVIYQ